MTDPTKLSHFPLEAAFLCADLKCCAVGNSASACPACGNSSLLSLARLLAGEHAAPVAEEPVADVVEVLP